MYEYSPPFPLTKDNTAYRKIDGGSVTTDKFRGQEVLIPDRDALEALTYAAFKDVNFFFRKHHLQSWRSILDDKEASGNDRFVAMTLLKNAVIASGRQLPSCQDTGTAIIMGKRGAQIWTDFDEEKAISDGVYRAYTTENLRYSQVAPLSMYTEKNTGCNMPAQIDIQSTNGSEYNFLCIAKGGGSANKMLFFQETRALLSEEKLTQWLKRTITTLGTAACPPYHLALVIGGTSAEQTMKTLKLATAGYLDNLPRQGSMSGHAFRDLETEAMLTKIAYGTGIGAQFGGKYFVHGSRVIRLPRHGASLPIGLGVSCSADRNILGKISAEGIFIEQLEYDPAQYLPTIPLEEDGEAVRINLNQPMQNVLDTLTKYPVKTRLILDGKLIVARDMAHARLYERLQKGEELPDYFKKYPIYYAGPAKTPDGMPSGSFGPTTAARMDTYVDEFQRHGGSKIMLAKGNRSKQVTEACKNNQGFYLGSIGGPAAQLAQDCITEVKVIDFEELGMEAVWEITIKDFPAFIVVDDKGNDFFTHL